MPSIGFMLCTPAYVGDAFLLAHLVGGQLVRHCQQLIPIALLPRFKFMDKVDNELRESVIARSIAICPSAYESFCLAAYEASALGALSILNGDNPAFGNDTPWKQHVNCEKFDGTSGDLLALLCKLWERREQWRLQPVTLSAPNSPVLVEPGKSEFGQNSKTFSPRHESYRLSFWLGTLSAIPFPQFSLRSWPAALKPKLSLFMIFRPPMLRGRQSLIACAIRFWLMKGT